MEQLLTEIRVYCEARGITPRTFGRYSVGDSKFVSRLDGGGECLPKTERRVRDYIAAHPVDRDERGAA